MDEREDQGVEEESDGGGIGVAQESGGDTPFSLFDVETGAAPEGAKDEGGSEKNEEGEQRGDAGARGDVTASAGKVKFTIGRRVVDVDPDVADHIEHLDKMNRTFQGRIDQVQREMEKLRGGAAAAGALGGGASDGGAAGGSQSAGLDPAKEIDEALKEFEEWEGREFDTKGKLSGSVKKALAAQDGATRSLFGQMVRALKATADELEAVKGQVAQTSRLAGRAASGGALLPDEAQALGAAQSEWAGLAEQWLGSAEGKEFADDGLEAVDIAEEMAEVAKVAFANGATAASLRDPQFRDEVFRRAMVKAPRRVIKRVREEKGAGPGGLPRGGGGRSRVGGGGAGMRPLKTAGDAFNELFGG